MLADLIVLPPFDAKILEKSTGLRQLTGRAKTSTWLEVDIELLDRALFKNLFILPLFVFFSMAVPSEFNPFLRDSTH